MRLFIAEKPSVAKAIAAELGVTSRGPGFIACGASTVTWCFGHLFEQADPDAYTSDEVPRGKSGRKLWRFEDLPIVPARWILQPKSDARSQIAIIGRLLRDATQVVHAGDLDREGQLLVDEVLEHFGTNTPVRRLWVSAQDSVSIRRGLEDLRSNAAYAGMANAARARQRADWLIGMNLSRAYTLRAQRGGSSALLTVGRVQTPTLALVVARDREIEAFTPQPFHKIEARFEHREGSFVATWKPQDDQAGLDADDRLVDTAVTNAIVAKINGEVGSVVAYTSEAKQKPARLCFSLADLTVLASRRYGFSAEQVLQACQALYETHKLTSYPRTDCGYLPVSQHVDAAAVLAAVRTVNPQLSALIEPADVTRRSPAWNDTKITAHHGIVPTMHEGDRSALSLAEREVYELIVRRYVAQFYPNHQYLQTRVTVEVAGESFAATGNLVTCVGWREVDHGSDSDRESEEQPKEHERLPAMRLHDAVTCARAERKDAETKPPARFTEGSLVRAMEQVHKWVTDPEHKKVLREGDGIGTSATRAAILSDLKHREFLAARGKHLVSTPLGRALVDAVPDAVKSPVLTALYERMLREIELGQGELEAFVRRQASFVAERVEQAKVGALTLPARAATPLPARARRRRVPAAKRASVRRKEEKRV